MAVGKVKLVASENFEFVGFDVVDFDCGQDVRNLLTVGTDVLDGGGAGETGDFGKAFDTGEAFGNGVFDDVVPVFATHNFEAEAVFDGFFEHSAHAVDDDYAVKTFVVTDGVGAKTENKSREFHGAGKAVSVFNVTRGFDLEDIASRAPQAHSG